MDPGSRPAPGQCHGASPRAGVRAGRRPPEGLGLDPGEDEVMLEARENAAHAAASGSTTSSALRARS